MSKMDTKDNEVFQVDTKGLCLLCLKDGCSTSGNCTNVSNFKMLLRYLKINAYSICNFTPSFLQRMDALEDVNVLVDLCNECTENIKMFSKLYQEMEFIRLQVDSCLQNVHDAMQRSTGNLNKMDEYRKRMRSRNMYDMFHANVADNLRDEAMKKCAQKVNSLIPRVTLHNREQSRLTNFYGFPTSSKHPQHRKIPGPKSKTQLGGTSKLKALLSGQDSYSTPSNPPLLSCLLGTGSGNMGNKTDGLEPEIAANGIECSEEFIVKVEPTLLDQDVLDFHDENEDSNVNNGFELENAAVIANYDGQLIGHFLGGHDEIASTSRIESCTSPLESGGLLRCEICFKAFSSAFSLGGHMHVHKNREKSNNIKKDIVKNIERGEDGTQSIPSGSHVPQKKKIKCAICKKILTNQKSYRAHCKRFHGSVPVGRPTLVTTKSTKSSMKGKHFDCEVCGKRFLSHTIHRTHMVSLHSMHVFAKYLPPGTTEDQLDKAIQGVLSRHRGILDPNKKKSKLYGCQYCSQVHPHPSHLRLHLLRNHFDKVVTMLQSMLNGTEDSVQMGVEANGECVDGISFECDNGEEEEEVIDPEPQPILLSNVYSLSGMGDLGQQKEIRNEFVSEDPLDSI